MTESTEVHNQKSKKRLHEMLQSLVEQSENESVWGTIGIEAEFKNGKIENMRRFSDVTEKMVIT